MEKIIHGESSEVLKTFPDNYFDSVVTDPPYGWKFMCRKWDYDLPPVQLWKEVLRVLKPGGYMLACCGTRTQHRMAVNIEDAGFEIRDVISWIYSTGFPKSLNISKAIDSQAGAERDVLYVDNTIARKDGRQGNSLGKQQGQTGEITAPATDEAKKWNGWGTALKPAQEMITLARKPLACPTVAENVLKYGTGGINIDGCRIEAGKEITERKSLAGHKEFKNAVGGSGKGNGGGHLKQCIYEGSSLGRFPANIIFDEFTAQLLDQQVPFTSQPCGSEKKTNHTDGMFGLGQPGRIYKDASTGASRFFYVAKASQEERDRGVKANNHPTVKPVQLMRYLCKMITPPSGHILDPFNGSGSTGIAAKLEGFDYTGIDYELDNIEITNARLKAWHKNNQLFLF